ncbi:epididymal-specific lipocalin-6 isoform 2-T2 [Glossophaga mutica]
MDVVELLRQNPAWVFRNPCKWARRVGRAPRPWAQRPAATPGPRGQGHLCSQASGHSLPGSETASFCQRLGANSEDRGLARAPATLGWDPRPPLCCVGRWDLAPVGTGSREPGPLCCGYSPDAPSTVTTSSVCGVGGVGGGTGPWPPQACWPRPTGLRSPARGVLEYRVLGTDFRDFAIVFTQLEQRDEAFSTVELYSRTQQASPEAVSRFTRWSQGLGFLSQQQAQLQADATCAHRAFQVSCLPSIVGLPGLPSRQEGPGALGAPAPLWAAGPSGQRARGQSRRLSSEPGSPVFVLVSSECCGPWGDSAHQDPVGLARRSLPCSAAQVLVVGPASPRGSGCRTK